MKILRGVSGNILTSFSGGIRKLLYVVQLGGYGRFYNWFCTQPQPRPGNGYLYNAYSVWDSRNISASNAHVPSYAEWNALIAYVGGESVACGKLKQSGFTHWSSDNTGTNDYLFNAFGSGVRNYGGSNIFQNIKNECYFWTTADYFTDHSMGIAAQLRSSTPTIWINFLVSNIGASIRLIVDSPIEIVDNSAIYVGNDLRRYKCCLINGVWYTAENLAETQYRNGDLISKVTDNTAWAALTTGAMCAYDNDEANAFETASIAPAGWHVPDYNNDVYALDSFLGGINISAKLMEVGLLHWDTNIYGTNESGFSSVGNGMRLSDGLFQYFKYIGGFLLKESETPGYNVYVVIQDGLSFMGFAPVDGMGMAIRLVKDDPSTWTTGDTLTDIDGNIYPTVKIGDQVWTTKNWKCTKFNDGTPIPLVEDNTEWSLLGTPGQCIYENNLSNL